MSLVPGDAEQADHLLGQALGRRPKSKGCCHSSTIWPSRTWSTFTWRHSIVLSRRVAVQV
jgi:hypothetical protein